MSSPPTNLIPRKVTLINGKVSLKHRSRLEGKVMPINANYSFKLRPITPLVIKILPLKRHIVEDDESNDADDEGGDEEEEEEEEDAISISTYSAEERDEDWEVSSLGTESVISGLNSEDIQYLADNYDPDWEPSSLGTPSVISPLSSPARGRRSHWGDSPHVQSEWEDPLDTYSPPNQSPELAEETYWELVPLPPSTWMTSRDWRYCNSCKWPHPSGELKRLLCVDAGLEDLKNCDDPTHEGARKRKRED
ncbi:hypothetical protein EDB19DRAFT_2021324 [Suillus lakei]|nr:hypothetical protein EDB19DRAFT_2021324 [Suillus lakei]